jgi:hypothetical protein
MTKIKKYDTFPIFGYGIWVPEDVFDNMYINFANLAVVEEYVDPEKLKEGEYMIRQCDIKDCKCEIKIPTNILLSQLLEWQGWEKEEAEMIEYVPSEFFDKMPKDGCVIYVHDQFDESCTGIEKKETVKNLFIQLGLNMDENDVLIIRDMISVPACDAI